MRSFHKKISLYTISALFMAGVFCVGNYSLGALACPDQASVDACITTAQSTHTTCITNEETEICDRDLEIEKAACNNGCQSCASGFVQQGTDDQHTIKISGGESKAWPICCSNPLTIKVDPYTDIFKDGTTGATSAGKRCNMWQHYSCQTAQTEYKFSVPPDGGYTGCVAAPTQTPTQNPTQVAQTETVTVTPEVTTTDNFSIYLDRVSELLYKNNDEKVLYAKGNIKGMIENFCEAVLGAGKFSQNNFDYDAQQSVFVYLLCSNIDNKLSFTAPGFKDASIFKLKTFAQLGIQDLRPIAPNATAKTNFCSPEAGKMTECDLSKYIPKLFNMIINDYANLKEPTLLGFNNTQNYDEAANEFSKKYYNINICDKQAPVYPNTCKKLQTYIQNAQKTITDVRIFFPAKINQDETTCVPGDKYSLLSCGLYGDTTNVLQSFLNLTYNEMLFYRLFMSYYTLMIRANPVELLDIPFTTANNEIYKRTTAFNNEIIRSQEAITTTMRMLRDMYSAFPLHIGFLMYQEDLLGFTKQLSKIYKPISQFYYTMQHVQIPK